MSPILDMNLIDIDHIESPIRRDLPSPRRHLWADRLTPLRDACMHVCMPACVHICIYVYIQSCGRVLSRLLAGTCSVFAHYQSHTHWCHGHLGQSFWSDLKLHWSRCDSHLIFAWLYLLQRPPRVWPGQWQFWSFCCCTSTWLATICWCACRDEKQVLWWFELQNLNQRGSY